MIQFIGFDIGIKNLAYSIIECNNKQIFVKTVNNVDLECKKYDTQKIIDAIIDLLDIIINNELNTDFPIVVLIESQMTSIMKCIQTVINTFFKINAKYQSLDITTKYVSAKGKLSLIHKFKNEYIKPIDTCTNKYKQNKLDSIHFGNWLLSNKFKHPDIINKINLMKKKDDVWDTINMTLYYIILNNIL
jgi:hypothetical protein